MDIIEMTTRWQLKLRWRPFNQRTKSIITKKIQEAFKGMPNEYGDYKIYFSCSELKRLHLFNHYPDFKIDKRKRIKFYIFLLFRDLFIGRRYIRGNVSETDEYGIFRSFSPSELNRNNKKHKNLLPKGYYFYVLGNNIKPIWEEFMSEQKQNER